jgi:hypothetical protein
MVVGQQMAAVSLVETVIFAATPSHASLRKGTTPPGPSNEGAGSTNMPALRAFGRLTCYKPKIRPENKGIKPSQTEFFVLLGIHF